MSPNCMGSLLSPTRLPKVVVHSSSLHTVPFSHSYRISAWYRHEHAQLADLFGSQPMSAPPDASLAAGRLHAAPDRFAPVGVLELDQPINDLT